MNLSYASGPHGGTDRTPTAVRSTRGDHGGSASDRAWLPSLNFQIIGAGPCRQVLWADEKAKTFALKAKSGEIAPARAEAKAARISLARSLSEMKDILSTPGAPRNVVSIPQTPWLFTHHGRSARWKVSGRRELENRNASANGAIEPTEAELNKLVRSLVSRCRVLTTESLVDVVLRGVQPAESGVRPGRV